MTLTKDYLVNAFAEVNGYPRNQAIELVETLIELIKSKLISGEDVLISGFGKFCVKKKRDRRGRNPATGKDMMLAARRVVTFKCSGKFRSVRKAREKALQLERRLRIFQRRKIAPTDLLILPKER